MKKLSCLSFFLLLISWQQIHAQSFNLRTVNDIFRSNLAFKSEIHPNASFSISNDTLNSNFGAYLNGIQATIPISGKLSVGMNWNKLKNFRDMKSWKDLTNVVPIDLTGHQLFLTLHGSSRLVNLDTKLGDNLHPTYHFGAGILGVHLRRKLRLLFYMANISLSEEVGKINSFRPKFEGAFGAARILNFSTLLYYGGYVTAGDGRFLPVPFVGVNFNIIRKKLSAQIILPLQIRLTYKPAKQWNIATGLLFSGFRTGLVHDQQYPDFLPSTNNTANRFDFNYTAFKEQFILTYFPSKRTRLELELGYLFARNIAFWEKGEQAVDYKVNGNVYASLLFQVNLGQKSLLRNIFDRLEIRH